jgi:hypothetical protein
MSHAEKPLLTPHPVERPIHPDDLARVEEVEVTDTPASAAEYAAALAAHEAGARANDARRRQEWLDNAALHVAGAAHNWPRGSEKLWAARAYEVAEALWDERKRRAEAPSE